MKLTQRKFIGIVVVFIAASVFLAITNYQSGEPFWIVGGNVLLAVLLTWILKRHVTGKANFP